MFDTEFSLCDFYKKNLLRYAPKRLFKKMILSRGRMHFVAKSELSLEKESFFWKLAWELIAAHFFTKNRTQGENSVSKIGFMIIDMKILQNESKSFEKIEVQIRGA